MNGFVDPVFTQSEGTAYPPVRLIGATTVPNDIGTSYRVSTTQEPERSRSAPEGSLRGWIEPPGYVAPTPITDTYLGDCSLQKTFDADFPDIRAASDPSRFADVCGCQVRRDKSFGLRSSPCEMRAGTERFPPDCLIYYSCL